MAATQGIRSAFSTQPIPYSPKLHIYEYLFLLNQKLQDAVHILRQLEKCTWLRRDFLRSFRVEVEDLRAQANFEVIEHLSDREQRDWARFGKLRRRLEAHLLDFEGDLYDQTLEVEVAFHIRDMLTFSSVDELTERMRDDVAR